MGFNKTIALISIALLGLSACSYTMEELGAFKTGGRLPRVFDVTQFSDKVVTFEVVTATSLSSCLQCHTTGSKSMNTAEKALALRTEILDSVQSGSMPPKSSGYRQLNECEKQILETWYEDQVAVRTPTRKVKELSHCGNMVPEKPKDPTDFSKLELTFANVTKEILAPKCLSCHTEEAAKKTVLETYTVIKDQGLLEATAEESLLYKVTVAGMAKRFMPPKNKGIPPLTPQESDFLKRWIDAGAPETAVKN
ncbi:hypothetical protein [Bdellovibrio sp. HCB2-146]|uniref:hypothetical protein n=1 Tax=Bdellovibrio sp. HCB2-146 TaxID=3394362 RepID=UPI0039BD1E9E